MVQASILALLFALFTVWCGLRLADAWTAGANGMAVVLALAALGGIPLTVRNLRRVRRSQS